MFSGYIVLGLLVAAFIVYKLVKLRSKKKKKKERVKTKETRASTEHKASRSDYSISSNESAAAAAASMSLVVLKNPAKELKFEELLRAPACGAARTREVRESIQSDDGRRRGACGEEDQGLDGVHAGVSKEDGAAGPSAASEGAICDGILLLEAGEACGV